jgi:hypothetical protein
LDVKIKQSTPKKKPLQTPKIPTDSAPKINPSKTIPGIPFGFFPFRAEKSKDAPKIAEIRLVLLLLRFFLTRKLAAQIWHKKEEEEKLGKKEKEGIENRGSVWSKFIKEGIR